MSGKELPDGITFDGHVYWCRCPECGEEQGDMGNNVACENCGCGPMPTMDTGPGYVLFDLVRGSA